MTTEPTLLSLITEHLPAGEDELKLKKVRAPPARCREGCGAWLPGKPSLVARGCSPRLY